MVTSMRRPMSSPEGMYTDDTALGMRWRLDELCHRYHCSVTWWVLRGRFRGTAHNA